MDAAGHHVCEFYSDQECPGSPPSRKEGSRKERGLEQGEIVGNESGDKVAYSVAANTFSYEVQAVWARFNAMLLANSIFILAIVGIAGLDSGGHVFLYKYLLPIAGLLMCLSWLFLNARGFAYHDYWHDSARNIEGRAFSPEITTFRQARVMGGQRLCLFEKVPARYSANFVTLVFVAVYVSLILFL